MFATMFARRCLSNGALMDSLFGGKNNKLEHTVKDFSFSLLLYLLNYRYFFRPYTRSISLALLHLHSITYADSRFMYSYQCLSHSVSPTLRSNSNDAVLFMCHFEFYALHFIVHRTIARWINKYAFRSHDRRFLLVLSSFSSSTSSSFQLYFANMYLRKYKCTRCTVEVSVVIYLVCRCRPCKRLLVAAFHILSCSFHAIFWIMTCLMTNIVDTHRTESQTQNARVPTASKPYRS